MPGYNFSERVRNILSNARVEADRLGQNAVTPEHILIALVKEPDGVARSVLENLDVDVDAVLEQVASRVPAGSVVAPLGDVLPYSAEAKAVLERTMEEAKGLMHSYVGTEHLLLGLLNSEGTVPAEILAGQGLTADGVSMETMRLVGAPPTRVD
jgi:ATP-dependent Clp protease ATP-binding subunit ClpC